MTIDNSLASAVSVDGDFEAVPNESGETIILPAPESSRGQEETAPEQETETDQQRQITLDPTVPFDQAQELVSFTLREPAFMPDGHEFQGVNYQLAGLGDLGLALRVAESVR